MSAILLLIIFMPLFLLMLAGIYLAFTIAYNCGNTQEAADLWIKECSK